MPAHDWSRADIAPAEVSPELRGLREAPAATSAELERLREGTSAEIGDDQAGIFGVQLFILADAQKPLLNRPFNAMAGNRCANCWQRGIL